MGSTSRQKDELCALVVNECVAPINPIKQSPFPEGQHFQWVLHINIPTSQNENTARSHETKDKSQKAMSCTFSTLFSLCLTPGINHRDPKPHRNQETIPMKKNGLVKSPKGRLKDQRTHPFLALSADASAAACFSAFACLSISKNIRTTPTEIPESAILKVGHV